MRFIFPMRNLRITSPFGQRVLNGEPNFHAGIDFAPNDGDSDVLAVADGVVVHDQDSYNPSKRFDLQAPDSGGRFVILQHNLDGQVWYTRYLHLASNKVSLGQHVAAGEAIGTFGNLGFSTGPHLHFDLYDAGWRIVDPTPFFVDALVDAIEAIRDEAVGVQA